MLASVPVLAANSGGPLETVIDGETGWLRDVAEVQAWTQVMRTVIGGGADEELALMGQRGRSRVIREFSEGKMARNLEAEIEATVHKARGRVLEVYGILFAVGGLGVLVVAVLAFLFRIVR